MWGQFTLIINSLSPKRDWVPKRVKGGGGGAELIQLFIAVVDECNNQIIMKDLGCGPGGKVSIRLLLTLLVLQFRFGDNCRQITYNLTGLPPKRDWSSKRVNSR